MKLVILVMVMEYLNIIIVRHVLLIQMEIIYIILHINKIPVVFQKVKNQMAHI